MNHGIYIHFIKKILQYTNELIVKTTVFEWLKPVYGSEPKVPIQVING